MNFELSFVALAMLACIVAGGGARPPLKRDIAVKNCRDLAT